MPFVRRHEVNPKVRRVFDNKRKAQLRASLSDPSISPEQRQHIKDELARVGQGRMYHKDKPPQPGAVSFPPPTVSRDAVKKVKKLAGKAKTKEKE